MTSKSLVQSLLSDPHPEKVAGVRAFLMRQEERPDVLRYLADNPAIGEGIHDAVAVLIAAMVYVGTASYQNGRLIKVGPERH
jgi:hypothetical protein